jgi:hypothetical protein
MDGLNDLFRDLFSSPVMNKETWAFVANKA